MLIRRNTIHFAIVTIACIVFFIFPTSFNGERYTSNQEIISWSILSLGIICLLMCNKINYKNCAVAFTLLVYMTITTLIANTNIEYEISLARIAPIICAIALFTLQIKQTMTFRYFNIVLNIMCILIVIWNILTLSNVQPVIDFVVRNYTQFYDYATEWQLTVGKPIFTFGVHNVAGFFYMQIFLLCYYTYKNLNKKIYLLYMIVIFGFTLLLTSTTSFGYSLIMLSLFFLIIKKNRILMIIYLLLLLITFGFLINSALSEKYIEMLFSPTNGFIPRYIGNETIFANNIEILNNNILGIGFTIPRGTEQAYFGDSGIMVYFTMGNIFLPIILYYLFFRFISINILPKYRNVLILTILLFELSLPSFMYIKSLYLYMFLAFFYSSLGNSVAKK